MKTCNSLQNRFVHFHKTIAGLAVALVLGFSVAATASPNPVDESLPLVGTGAHGHTYPGATVPFGMVQMSPDTRTEGWDWCSGYHYPDSVIQGFTHTHLSGTGATCLGDVLLMPTVGQVYLNAGSPGDANAPK